MSNNEKNLFNNIQDTSTLFSTAIVKNTPINYFNQGHALDKITQLTGKTQNEVLYSIADYFFSQGLNVIEIAEKINQDKSIVQRLLRNKIKEQITVLLKEKNKTSQISRKLGIENQTTRRWIKEITQTPSEKLYDKDLLEKVLVLFQEGKSFFETAHILNIRHEFLREILRNNILLEYMQLKGAHKIAIKYHMDITTISKMIRDANIVINADKMNMIYVHFNNSKYTLWREISPLLQEILEGELLGDGYLAKPFRRNKQVNENIQQKNIPTIDSYIKALETLSTIQMLNQFRLEGEKASHIIHEFNNALNIIWNSSSSSFGLHVSIREEKWVNYLSNILTMNNYSTNIIKRKYVTQKGNIEWELELTTKYSIQLGKELQRWYPNGKKIIPRDITITPTLLLHFYIGDGSYNFRNIFLYTNDFVEEDVIFLSEKLNRVIGLNSSVYKSTRANRPNKVYPIIHISGKENRKKFFEYLEQAYPESLQLAKTAFPWKFDANLRRKDVLKEREKNSVDSSI